MSGSSQSGSVPGAETSAGRGKSKPRGCGQGKLVCKSSVSVSDGKSLGVRRTAAQVPGALQGVGWDLALFSIGKEATREFQARVTCSENVTSE